MNKNAMLLHDALRNICAHYAEAPADTFTEADVYAKFAEVVYEYWDNYADCANAADRMDEDDFVWAIQWGIYGGTESFALAYFREVLGERAESLDEYYFEMGF